MADISGASDSAFEKKVTEQTAVSAFQLAWGIVKKIGLKGWEQKQVRAAMKKYATNYRERHGEVKVLGMSQPVPLHQIYTAVRVVKPDYLHAFTRPEELEESFRDSKRRHAQFSTGESRDGVEAANEEAFLNVLGAPGAGKSTFLRRIGQEAMLARTSTKKLSPDKLLDSRYKHQKLPVLLELRRLRDDGGKTRHR